MFEHVLAQLTLTLELTGTKWSDDAVQAAANRLKQFPPEQTLKALTLCQAQLSRPMRLADILERIPQPEGHAPLSPDVAWEKAVGARIWDEDATIVVPKAIFMAFPLAVWNSGDQIAARRAFIEIYPAMLAKYGQDIEASDGLNPNGRDAVLREAVDAGRISHLPSHALPPPEPDTENRALGPETLYAMAEQAVRTGQHGRAAKLRRRAQNIGDEEGTDGHAATPARTHETEPVVPEAVRELARRRTGQ